MSASCYPAAASPELRGSGRILGRVDVVVLEENGGSRLDLHLQRFDETGKPAGESVGIVSSLDLDLHGAFSPDDRFVAYSSRESGVEHVYLSKVDGAGRWQVSDADGGQAPRWSGDGRRIYYLRGAGANAEIRLVEISIEEGSPRLGRPQVELSTPLALIQSTSASFDVHPLDGSLVVTAALWELETSGHPVLVQDWGMVWVGGRRRRSWKTPAEDLILERVGPRAGSSTG